MVMVRRRTNRMAWGLAASLGALAGCARDQAQRVYSTAPAEILTANWLGIHSVLSAVQSVVFSPDGKTLATGGQDCKVTLWNTATWRRERTC